MAQAILEAPAAIWFWVYVGVSVLFLSIVFMVYPGIERAQGSLRLWKRK